MAHFCFYTFWRKELNSKLKWQKKHWNIYDWVPWFKPWLAGCMSGGDDLDCWLSEDMLLYYFFQFVYSTVGSIRSAIMYSVTKNMKNTCHLPKPQIAGNDLNSCEANICYGIKRTSRFFSLNFWFELNHNLVES